MKIKHILLLGIVGILGLGFSSASNILQFHAQVSRGYSFPSGTGEFILGDNCIYLSPGGWSSNSIGYFGFRSDLLNYVLTNKPLTNFPDKISIKDGLVCGNGISYSTTNLYNAFEIPNLFSLQSGNYLSPSFYSGFTIEPGFNNLNEKLGLDGYGLCFITYGGSSTYSQTLSFYSNNVLNLDYAIGTFPQSNSNNIEVYCSERNLWLYNSSQDSYNSDTAFYSSHKYGFFTGLYVVPNYGGNTQNSTIPDGSIFDYNTYLIEQAVKCYMSSGTIGICEGINYTGYIQSLGTSSVLWFPDEQRGYLEFYNAKPVLTQYCYNSNMISYAFCSQLDIYEGVDLLYYYESGVLDFYMLGSGFGISADSLGSGQIGSITCQGAWCNGNVSTGLTEYIIPVGSSGFDYTGNINYYDGVFSGNLLSGEYFKDLFFNHLFFDCPYEYKDNAFVIGGKLINLLGGRDIIYPVNCIIAGYQEGYKSSLFGSVDEILPWTGSLLNSDSDGFKKLYLFFDIILSFGIALLFIKFFSSHSH